MGASSIRSASLPSPRNGRESSNGAAHSTSPATHYAILRGYGAVVVCREIGRASGAAHACCVALGRRRGCAKSLELGYSMNPILYQLQCNTISASEIALVLREKYTTMPAHPCELKETPGRNGIESARAGGRHTRPTTPTGGCDGSRVRISYELGYICMQ